MVVLLLLLLFASPGTGTGGPAIPGYYGPDAALQAPAATALPALLPGGRLDNAFVNTPQNNSLTVEQNADKAVIDWQSFDIGQDASVHFEQQSSWSALNVIHDADPSRIYGGLTAEGTIHLINQNGILFGPGSTVNVHTLVASALSLDANDFLLGNPAYKAVSYTGQALDPDATVANHGTITTESGGGVFFLAPRVENAGSITSEAGQIGLAAGTEISLAQDDREGSSRTQLLVRISKEPGLAVNYEGGLLSAPVGLVGMYGKTIRQDGIIRAVTAVKKAGKIELMASDRITTGASGRTESPVSASVETVHKTFEFEGGSIFLTGLNDYGPSPSSPALVIGHNGYIGAPSGEITLAGSERVCLAGTSTVDASGAWVGKDAVSLMITAQLNSVEMRDETLQKGGVLQGAAITFPAQKGSGIGNISGSLSSEERTALEQATHGGTIILAATDGEVIVREGALLDISGGGMAVEGGHAGGTLLASAGKVYDISSAPDNLRYDRILGAESVSHGRFGLTDTYKGLYTGGAAPFADYGAGYVQGGDAGTLRLIGRSVVLDGTLWAGAYAGLYQTLPADPEDENGYASGAGARRPSGGTLVVGDQEGRTQTFPEFTTEDIRVVAETVPLPPDFGPDTAMPALMPEVARLTDVSGNAVPLTFLSAAALSGSGLSNIDLYANTQITVAEDAALTPGPGNWSGLWKTLAGEMAGRVSLTARSVNYRVK
jgi:filamentous hemagglutinin family protein